MHADLAVAPLRLGPASLVTLNAALFDLLPAIPQIDIDPAECAGFAWPATRPELMKHKRVVVRPFKPEGLEDQFALFARIRVNAAFDIRQRKRVEEVAVKELSF